MNIEDKSLKFMSEVADKFGLPTPRDPQQTEVFGCYPVSTGKACLLYEAPTQQWRKLEPPEWDEGQHHHAYVWFPSCGEAEMERVLDCDTIKGMLPRPPLPSSMDVTVMEPPFLHEGWRYAWLFVPALRRWEIAPLGRA